MKSPVFLFSPRIEHFSQWLIANLSLHQNPTEHRLSLSIDTSLCLTNSPSSNSCDSFPTSVTWRWPIVLGSVGYEKAAWHGDGLLSQSPVTSLFGCLSSVLPFNCSPPTCPSLFSVTLHRRSESEPREMGKSPPKHFTITRRLTTLASHHVP